MVILRVGSGGLRISRKGVHKGVGGVEGFALLTLSHFS